MAKYFDYQHHMNSLLARESLLDKDVMAATDTPVVSMLPDVHVVKIGSRSILEAGRDIVLPVVEMLGKIMKKEKLILGVGGGARSRHVFAVGLDLELPTGVLAQLPWQMPSATPIFSARCWHLTVSSPFHRKYSAICCPCLSIPSPASSSTECPPIRCGSIRRRWGKSRPIEPTLAV